MSFFLKVSFPSVFQKWFVNDESTVFEDNHAPSQLDFNFSSLDKQQEILDSWAEDFVSGLMLVFILATLTVVFVLQDAVHTGLRPNQATQGAKFIIKIIKKQSNKFGERCYRR